MMNVPHVDRTDINNARTTSSTTTNKTLAKDDFLKMFLTQLKNQNPMQPISGMSVTNQLAQFTSLEQMTNMGNQLKKMNRSNTACTNAQSIYLIGKEVAANAGNQVQVDGASTKLSYNLGKAAQQVTIHMYDASGTLVNTASYSGQGRGINTVTWNTANVAKGNYTFDVTASDGDGNKVSATALISGTVTGIQSKDGTLYITVGGQTVPFSSIVSVKKPQS